MTTFWIDPTEETDRVGGDPQYDLLAVPQAMAAEIVAMDCPDILRVVDVGSGLGGFLARFLDRFPDAQGVWSDVSVAVEQKARERLKRFEDRVTYRIADPLDFADISMNLDVIMTSQTLHQLDFGALRSFYLAAADHLAPGGWLVNLDHMSPNGAWKTRLREACKRSAPPTEQPTWHPHDDSLTSVDDHLAALGGAGLRDVDIPWRAFVTCLFMARRDE